jgi:drug/metabolite transporter (DMT)-like permease
VVSVNLIYGVVLSGALLHAVWNALIKGSADTLLSAISITTMAALIAACALPWLPQPEPASWPFLAASLALQLLYMGLVARIYHVADMGASYPVMRGSAPLIVALVSATLFRESFSLASMAGIALICGGIFCVGAAPQHHGSRPRALRLTLLTAVVIAGYTLVDGNGVRHSGAPVGYTLWIFLLQGVGMLLVGARQRGRRLLPHLRADWRRGLIGGFGTIASYGTALWAMTLAPIAVIAALRETSILFGVLIAAFVLREQLGFFRASGAGLLVLGAVVLRLA